MTIPADTPQTMDELRRELTAAQKRIADQSKALLSYEDCIDGLNLRIAELEQQLEDAQRWRTRYSPMEKT